MESMDTTIIQRDDNLYKKEHTKGLPYFIILKKSNDKAIKIPCSNEAVAKRLLYRFKQVEPFAEDIVHKI